MNIFTSDTVIPLATELATLLNNKGYLCATAESCTGGLLAAAFTSCAGSSNWFERGFVTYSNQSKIDNLGVSLATLDEFGAVSEPTAMEMASGILVKIPKVSFALSTTGIAGPGGGTAGKPVGMVCFGIAKRTTDGINSRAFTHLFNGDRNTIRMAAVQYLLQAAIDELKILKT